MSCVEICGDEIFDGRGEYLLLFWRCSFRLKIVFLWRCIRPGNRDMADVKWQIWWVVPGDHTISMGSERKSDEYPNSVLRVVSKMVSNH